MVAGLLARGVLIDVYSADYQLAAWIASHPDNVAHLMHERGRTDDMVAAVMFFLARVRLSLLQRPPGWQGDDADAKG